MPSEKGIILIGATLNSFELQSKAVHEVFHVLSVVRMYPNISGHGCSLVLNIKIHTDAYPVTWIKIFCKNRNNYLPTMLNLFFCM